jgi:hypothetical protein
MSKEVHFTQVGEILEQKLESDAETLKSFSLFDYEKDLNKILAEAKVEAWGLYAVTIKNLISANEKEKSRVGAGDPNAKTLSDEGAAILVFAEDNLRDTTLEIGEDGVNFVFPNERFAAALDMGTREIPPVPIFTFIRSKLYEGAAAIVLEHALGGKAT